MSVADVFKKQINIFLLSYVVSYIKFKLGGMLLTHLASKFFWSHNMPCFATSKVSPLHQLVTMGKGEAFFFFATNGGHKQHFHCL